MFGFKKNDWRSTTVKNNEDDMPIFKEMAPLLRGAKFSCNKLLGERNVAPEKNEHSKITAFYLGIIEGDLLKHNANPEQSIPMEILLETLFRLAGYIDMVDEDTNTEEDWRVQNEKYVKAYLNDENNWYRNCGIAYSSHPDTSWDKFIEKLNNE